MIYNHNGKLEYKVKGLSIKTNKKSTNPYKQKLLNTVFTHQINR